VDDALWIKRHLDERFGLFFLHESINAELFIECLPTARRLSQLVIQELDPHHLPATMPNIPELVECEDTIRSQAFFDGLRRIYLHENVSCDVTTFDKGLAVKIACLQQCHLVRVKTLPTQLKRVDTEEVIASGADKNAAEVKCSGILNDRTIYVCICAAVKQDRHCWTVDNRDSPSVRLSLQRPAVSPSCNW
jgi:hypothetical protein